LKFCSSSAHADFDLDEVLAYIDELPERPANRILDSLEETLQSIAGHPFLGAPHSHLTRLLGEEVRSRLVAPYRIFYRMGRSTPEIISILHGARNQSAILGTRFSPIAPFPTELPIASLPESCNT